MKPPRIVRICVRFILAAFLLVFPMVGVGEDLAEAEKAARQRLAAAEAEHGPDHPEVGLSLHALAAARLKQEKWEGTPPLMERAIAILEDAYGPDHDTVLDLLNNLALAVGKLGEIERARDIHERVLNSLERSHGHDDPVLLASLMNLGVLCNDGGSVYEAVEHFGRALAIAEKSGSNDHESARLLLNLAVATKGTGDLAEARLLYQRAQESMEKSVGPEHLHLAIVLGQFAQLLRDEGRFAEARGKHERALAILEKTHGPEHRMIAHNLANLGEVYWALQDRAAARRELERALAMLEHVLPADHGDISYVLEKLGILLGEMGDFEKAKEYLERKLAMDRRRDAPGAVAAALIALAELGGTDLAELKALHERALALREEAYDPDHPDVAASLRSLAGIMRESGQAEAAAPLLARALKIHKGAFGLLHPEVGRTELELARLQLVLGDSGAALQSALRGERILSDHLRLTMRALIERRALGLAGERASGLDLALSIAVDDPSRENARRAWDAVVRSRAIVFDEMAARTRAVAGGRNEEVARLARDLAHARARLANLVVRGPDEEHPEHYQPLLERALQAKEEAERALADGSASFREEQLRGRSGVNEVLSALPRNSSLVAFVQYDRLRPDREETPSYLAFVLPSSNGRPVLVPLGAADRIDALVAAWRMSVSGKPPAGRAARRRAERDYREVAEALRRRIWDPIRALLGGGEQLLVVPDGSLNLVNLVALPVDVDRYLVESDFVIHTLSAERDVVRVKEDGKQGEGLLALGGPAFDTAPGSPAVPAPALYRGQLASCEDFRELRFAPLPASLEEIERISGKWPEAEAITLTGTKAREEALKSLAPGRRVLHFATHGFFLDRHCSSQEGGNPLVLSGLALAGSNRRDAVGADQEDGVLTSEEITSLELHGVEWVVLSACETGIGEVLPGEGVLGLRRAFQLAGAGSLIMSLWSVQDEAALEWMDSLYAGRGAGLSTAGAVRNAAIEMIEKRRDAGRGTHPFYWGAFVATGDWR